MAEAKARIRYRILMLIPELGYGGAEKSLLRLSRFLNEYHDVSIAVFKRHYAKGGYASEDEDIGIPLTILDAGTDTGTGRTGRWLNRWKKLHVMKQSIDITISFLTGANILNAVTGGPGNKVISMRGSRRYDPGLTALSRNLYEYLFDPLTYLLSDKIISISDGLSKEIGAHLWNSTKEKIETIELFVDAEELIARSKGEIEDEIEELIDQPVIITAGRLSPEKGFQYLIPIFADVHRRVPSAKLILIGDGPLWQELVDLCEKLNLSVCIGHERARDSAVVFLGYRKDPIRYYRIARLFVLTSLTEGFSNTVLEALAAGKAVIATNCPWGPRSILWKEPHDVEIPYPTEESTEADYGVLMPRIDQSYFHERWANTLINMLGNPLPDKEAAEFCRNRVREFDSSRIGHKWLNLIQKLRQPTS